MLELNKLTTEARNPQTAGLDTMTPLEIATVMNREDEQVVAGVGRVLPQVAAAIAWVQEAFEAGGKLVYMGAGTSGRLGVLDSVECPPTFGVPPEMVVGLIAGGERAFVRAVEGAEDSEALALEELKALPLTGKDVVIGIAASGRTPYVIGGLRYARSLGCKTVAVACNEGSLVGEAADLAIEPVVGPEVLTGSTRLKAGTAQKMILNMISTGAMVGIGKVYQNLMVDVLQTNEKLRVRARNIVTEATGCTEERAASLLEAAGGNAKTAIVMELLDCTAGEAEQKLKCAHGHIRKCL
ncbi:MAG: N-acetylmuramic acid 6-phosphate etherase [Enterocloster asparagiformis]|nr:N-acetylmuramic acid 6-phosphate etherase [Enterocloster asparagiformis]